MMRCQTGSGRWLFCAKGLSLGLNLAVLGLVCRTLLRRGVGKRGAFAAQVLAGTGYPI